MVDVIYIGPHKEVSSRFGIFPKGKKVSVDEGIVHFFKKESGAFKVLEGKKENGTLNIPALEETEKPKADDCGCGV